MSLSDQLKQFLPKEKRIPRKGEPIGGTWGDPIENKGYNVALKGVKESLDVEVDENKLYSFICQWTEGKDMNEVGFRFRLAQSISSNLKIRKINQQGA